MRQAMNQTRGKFQKPSRRPPGGGGGGPTQEIFIRGGSAQRSSPLPFELPFFHEKGTPLVYLLSTNGTPFIYFINLLALLDLSQNQMTDFPPLSNTSTSKIPILSYTLRSRKIEKGTPFGRNHPEKAIIGSGLTGNVNKGEVDVVH